MMDPHTYHITVRRSEFEGEVCFEARVKELPTSPVLPRGPCLYRKLQGRRLFAELPAGKLRRVQMSTQK